MGNAGSQARKSETERARTSEEDGPYPFRQPRMAAVSLDIPSSQQPIPQQQDSPFFLYGSPLSSPICLPTPLDKLRPSNNQAIPSQANQKLQPQNSDGLIPTVFRWTHGGANVFVTGTFNNWKERIPLNRSHEEFATIINLPVGTHQYKFIVDNEWRYNPDQPTMPDRSGAVNNFLEVDDEEDAFDFEDFVSAPAMSSSPPGAYEQCVPKLDHTTKPPPVLPPHLMQVLLNCEPVSRTDPSLLPIPNHVMLNHLYALSISDGVMVLGMTHRFQQKYVTTVLYRPVIDD
jgi:5'-AMP-activated protein kinase regulatory beta subunit